MNQAFFLWALGYGLHAAWSNLFLFQAWTNAPYFWLAWSAFFLLMSIGTMALARTMLLGSPVKFRNTLMLPLVAGSIIAIPMLASTFVSPATYGRWLGMPTQNVWAFQLMGTSFTMAMVAAIVLACTAAKRAAIDSEQAPQMAAITVAALIYPAMNAAFWLRAGDPIFGFGLVGLLLVSAGWWLIMVRDSDARLARNVAVWPLIIALTGYLLTVLLANPTTLLNVGFYGLGPVLSAGIIAFAIVRHQILGFDVKVRRGIKGSTLAALFFAVFFVVSESTAQILGETKAGPFLGIAVAGILVFFLAPLQRWADRVAGAATGDAKPPEAHGRNQAVNVYRRTAGAAWADGSVDAKERILLDELRESLGLSHKDAAVLEREAAEASQP